MGLMTRLICLPNMRLSLLTDSIGRKMRLPLTHDLAQKDNPAHGFMKKITRSRLAFTCQSPLAKPALKACQINRFSHRQAITQLSDGHQRSFKLPSSTSCAWFNDTQVERIKRIRTNEPRGMRTSSIASFTEPILNSRLMEVRSTDLPSICPVNERGYHQIYRKKTGKTLHVYQSSEVTTTCPQILASHLLN